MKGRVYASCVRSSMTYEELRRLVGVEPITTVIIGGRLRWYGHVMRQRDENWVKKCMEFRVEGRRLVRRPRRTWLESVEAHIWLNLRATKKMTTTERNGEGKL